ncbi:MAG: flavodoxin domain-containing protein [Bacillota bacterium]|nr:flavodoxin domain-containing protein [Bacillota bacterium]
MNSLIIYTTKHGCVEKAANLLKEKLTGQVQSVNAMKQAAPSLDEYDTIILGGSIYMGRIQKELTNYVSKNLPLLMNKKIGLFICAGSPEENARSKELTDSFPPELYSHAKAKEIFGSEIIFSKLGFFEKMITKAISHQSNDILELNEAAIDKFAKDICQG